MTDYAAPVDDIRFSSLEVSDFAAHYAKTFGDLDLGADDISALLEAFGEFCAGEVVPTNRDGDEIGCRFSNGEVTTPPGFREAWKSYADGGWPSLDQSAEFGGQGLPPSLTTLLQEVSAASNPAWHVYTVAAHGAMETLVSHGTPEQKETYLGKLVTGQWGGTMCLTEPHCGSDLGLIRTTASPQSDGTYAMSGTKIFISGGEHDLTENIVHIVLARLPGSPAGTKGLSLFIVPKFLPDGASLGERNGVYCRSIEKKMGIHGSSTCELEFDAATAYLIGEENRGLQAMFTFMNSARLGSAVGALGHIEQGFQKASSYALERRQMRSISGAKDSDAPADRIIVHPDVRRMLMIQKAFAEGGRMLIHDLAKSLDVSGHSSSEDEHLAASRALELLTPVAKGFLTEVSLECASLAIQCFGGHGYVRDWGVEQNYRDCRIGSIWEGTTGIQSLDLLARKVAGSGGETLFAYLDAIAPEIERWDEVPDWSERRAEFDALIAEWRTATTALVQKGARNPEALGAASVDYLLLTGYMLLGFHWGRAARKSHEKIAAGAADAPFLANKLATSRFYFDHILPRARFHLTALERPAETIMSVEETAFDRTALTFGA